MSVGIKVKDYKVNGERLLDRIKSLFVRSNPAEQESTQVQQTGASIAKSKAVTLDADNKAEVIFKDDERFDKLVGYAKQVGEAIKCKDASKLPENHGFSKQQTADIFSGNQQLKEKALCENFNMQMKKPNAYGGYDKGTSDKLSELEKHDKLKHIQTVLTAIDAPHNIIVGAEAKSSILLDKFSKKFSSTSDYNIIPEHTREMANPGKPGIVCRHQAPIGAAMLDAAGVPAVSFSNVAGGGKVYGSGGHAAVYLPATGNIAEFTTSKPENTYQLNIFGNNLDGKGISGRIYTISAQNPSGQPCVYDPTQEVTKQNVRSLNFQCDTHSIVLAQQIAEVGAVKVKEDIMGRIGPNQACPQGLDRPENTELINLTKIAFSRATEFAKEDLPNAVHVLQQAQTKMESLKSDSQYSSGIQRTKHNHQTLDFARN